MPSTTAVSRPDSTAACRSRTGCSTAGREPTALVLPRGSACTDRALHDSRRQRRSALHRRVLLDIKWSAYLHPRHRPLGAVGWTCREESRPCHHRRSCVHRAPEHRVPRRDGGRPVGGGGAKFREQGRGAEDDRGGQGQSIDYVRRTLFNDRARVYEYLDGDVIRELIEEHLHGKENRSLLIWSLLNVGAFLERYLT